MKRRSKRRVFLALLTVGCLGFSHSLFAQNHKAKKKSRGPTKKVMISFDEDLVEGSMTGAELFMIMRKKQTKFGSLFELRENFIPEMHENSEGVQ